tara:strand:+ start:2127 stop:2402 length:276 start_codon:yes stop_codon:yes gene_type:complete
MKNENPLIRKITMGDLKNGITYQVGQKMLGGRLTITAILQDEPAWYKYQKIVYDVYVREGGGVNSTPWKRFFDQPTAVEYYITPPTENEVA